MRAAAVRLARAAAAMLLAAGFVVPLAMLMAACGDGSEPIAAAERRGPPDVGPVELVPVRIVSDGAR